MATNTDTAPNTEIDQVLGQTEFGEWVAKNKVAVISLVVLIIAGIFGFGIFTTMKNKQAQEMGNKVYTFQEGAYTQLIDEKMKPADYVAEYKKIEAEVDGFEGLAPVLIKSSGHLVEQGANKEAVEILESGLKNFKTPLLSYIISVHLAAALEDMKEYPRAIEVLENLNSASTTLLEDKIYLDLGRLYMASGNQEKAKVNLQYLIDNGKEAEFIKIARLMLEDLEQGK